MTAAQGAGQQRKNICADWAHFRCNFGDACRFSHDGPGGPSHAQGGGGRGPDNRWRAIAEAAGKAANRREDGKDERISIYDTLTSYGVAARIPKSLKPCPHWAKFQCNFGEACGFSHDGPGGPTPQSQSVPQVSDQGAWDQQTLIQAAEAQLQAAAMLQTEGTVDGDGLDSHALANLDPMQLQQLMLGHTCSGDSSMCDNAAAALGNAAPVPNPALASLAPNPALEMLAPAGMAVGGPLPGLPALMPAIAPPIPPEPPADDGGLSLNDLTSMFSFAVDGSVDPSKHVPEKKIDPRPAPASLEDSMSSRASLGVGNGGSEEVDLISVEIMNEGAKLGMGINSSTLVIAKITGGGLLSRYNEQSPQNQVCIGDKIDKVNGVKLEFIAQYHEMIANSRVAKLTLARKKGDMLVGRGVMLREGDAGLANKLAASVPEASNSTASFPSVLPQANLSLGGLTDLFQFDAGGGTVPVTAKSTGGPPAPMGDTSMGGLQGMFQFDASGATDHVPPMVMEQGESLSKARGGPAPAKAAIVLKRPLLGGKGQPPSAKARLFGAGKGPCDDDMPPFAGVGCFGPGSLSLLPSNVCAKGKDEWEPMLTSGKGGVLGSGAGAGLLGAAPCGPPSKAFDFPLKGKGKGKDLPMGALVLAPPQEFPSSFSDLPSFL